MNLMFYLSGLVSILATIRVITHIQPMHALLYLIVSLLAIACVFFSLGAHFVGALEIIIYAGAIMVLFIFVVMMLNTDFHCFQQERAWLRPRIWIGPSFMSALLLVTLLCALAGIEDHDITENSILPKTIGIALFGPYLLVVELASMLLLGGLVVAFHFGHDKQNNFHEIHKKLKISKTIKKKKEDKL